MNQLSTDDRCRVLACLVEDEVRLAWCALNDVDLSSAKLGSITVQAVKETNGSR